MAELQTLNNKINQLIKASPELISAANIPLPPDWFRQEYLKADILKSESDRSEQLVRYHVKHSGICTWGIISIKIATALIQKGVFHLESLVATLPNGFEIGLNDEVPKLNFNKLFIGKNEGTAFVELVVTQGDQGNSNRKEKLIYDQEGDLPPIRIERIKLSCHLVVVGEKKHTQIENRITLARIENRAGTFRLQEYIPPVQKISNSKELTTMISTVTETLTRYYTYLNRQLSGLSPLKTDLQIEWMIKDRIDAIFTMLPLLKLDLSCDHSHPYTLFRTLCSVAGRVSTISNSMELPEFDTYQHHKIRDSFREIIDFIEKTLKDNIVEHYRTLPFEYSEKHFCYSLKLRPEWKSQPLIIGVETNTDVVAAEVTKWFFDCTIGSEEKIDEIRRKRISGVDREEIRNTPNLIPVGNIDLFRLDRESEYLTDDDTLIIENVTDRHEKDSKVINLLLYLRKE